MRTQTNSNCVGKMALPVAAAAGEAGARFGEGQPATHELFTIDSQPDLEKVCQAIKALHRSPDNAGKERASVWLGELQRSVHAWQTAVQLLQQKNEIEECYFAAQTMRTKVQYSFHELPPDFHQQLRDILIQLIGQITADTNPAIVTQLCLALVDLALQMASWKMAISDLIQRYTGNMQHLPVLLEIITVLPEEVNSRSLRLGANRRDEMMKEICDVAPDVLKLLVLYSEKPDITDPRLMPRILRCLGSWFSIGAIPTAEVAQSQLIVNIFQLLMETLTPSMIHEAACDCICSAIVLIEDLSKHMELAQVLFQGVHALPKAYHDSVAKEETDKSINYCRIFTELAESLLELMVETPGQGLGDLRTLDMVLNCVGHHDYEVAEITFNLWYRLSEVLYKKNNDDLNNIFKPYIERLLSALCRHCQMEPDHENIPDDNDDFSDFRIRVSELIKDVVFIIGSSNCFQQMFNNLRNQGPTATWDMSEASLFVMSAVARNIVPEENDIVPQVIDAILHLPDNTHVAVRYTSIQLIGEFRDWIEKHPHTLEPILNFLHVCLHQPQLATVAATTLQNICSTCTDEMGSYFVGLLHIIQAMESFNISNEAAVGLLKGASLILARMPLEKIPDGMMQLCHSQVTPLSQLLINVPPQDGKRADPTVWLDRLAAIFRHTNPIVTNGQTHPCFAAVQETWPVLSETCNKYQSDVRIVERCCRCIRFAVRCIGKQSAPLLEPLVKQIVGLYQVYKHSCFLYLGSILVDEYGMEPECIAGLLKMLEAFSLPTFELFNEPSGLRNHPDTVDDFYRLCTRFLQRSALAFLHNPHLQSIVQYALAACTLDHRDANASIMKFFNELVHCHRSKDEAEDFAVRQEMVDKLLKELGSVLVTNLINACLFYLPSFMIPDIAEVVYELMLYDRPSVCVWLERALKNLPTQSSGGSVTATHKQLTDFHKAITSSENEKTVKKALQEFMRLFR